MRLTLIPVEDFPKEVQPTPTEDLIEVYKTCLLLQDLCQRKRLQGLSALQVGIPWALFVLCHWEKDNQLVWHYYLNPSYTPVSDEKQFQVVRFVNVERDRRRYFLVKRYKDIQYRVHELIVNTQPELVERVGTDPAFGIFVQNECDLLSGKYPHVEGEEYWLRK
jgi:peptide deformylase